MSSSSRNYRTINNSLNVSRGQLNIRSGKKKKEELQPVQVGDTDLGESCDSRSVSLLDLRKSLDHEGVHLPQTMEDHSPDPPKPGSKSCGEEDYNPLLNRDLEHPTSNLDTMIHLLKVNIGTGILAMPNAFHNAGLVVGTLGTLGMGVICTHCMHMLVNCSHELCMRSQVAALGFSDVCESSFATGPGKLRRFSRFVRLLTNLFLVITQLGFCCVYVLFVAINLQEVVGHYYRKFGIHWYLLALLIPTILMNWINNLKYLAPVSLFASLLTSSGLGITFSYMLQGLQRTSTVHAFSSWRQLPLFFGTAIYAFEGIGAILPLQNNMKTPQDFVGLTGVLNTGMVIVTCLYTAIGFFGYLKYGDEVKVGTITLNLPPNDLLAQSVRLLMAQAIFLSYGLQFYVAMSIIWPPIKARIRDEQSQRVANLMMRTALVILTLGLAAAIPNLANVISLVGAVSSSTLALIFPPIIELVTFWDKGLSPVTIIKDLLIMVFGILGFIFGSYVSLSNILSSSS